MWETRKDSFVAPVNNCHSFQVKTYRFAIHGAEERNRNGTWVFRSCKCWRPALYHQSNQFQRSLRIKVMSKEALDGYNPNIVLAPLIQQDLRLQRAFFTL